MTMTITIDLARLMRMQDAYAVLFSPRLTILIQSSKVFSLIPFTQTFQQI